jgi:hypothetical protein
MFFLKNSAVCKFSRTSVRMVGPPQMLSVGFSLSHAVSFCIAVSLTVSCDKLDLPLFHAGQRKTY